MLFPEGRDDSALDAKPTVTVGDAAPRAPGSRNVDQGAGPGYPCLAQRWTGSDAAIHCPRLPDNLDPVVKTLPAFVAGKYGFSADDVGGSKHERVR